ncbi:MAG TPA: S9 family peptidase [Thermoanaerobaculia bacterium]|nr:S9 family peptidase [Thermoanaerobaculia bacterium]
MKKLAISAAILLVSLPLFAEKRAFTIEDFYRIRDVSELAVSRDGRRVAFTVESTDLPHHKRTTRIWMTGADGADPHEVTSGDRDSNPAFSADGRWLSFVRTKDDQSNLYLLPLAGGEPHELTKISTGVSDPIWSPDSKRMAFSSDVYAECGGDDTCNKRISDRWTSGKLKAHMADELLFRHWKSWRDGTVTHTFVVDVDSGTARDLTPGNVDFPPFQLGGPPQYDFSPDGSELVVSSNPDRRRASSTNNDLYLVSVTNPAAPRDITADNKAYDGSPKYSPDGRYIAYRRQRDPGYESSLFQLAIYDRRSGTSRVITGQFNNWIDDFDWSDDSKSISFTGPVEGVNPIFRVNIENGAITRVFEDRTIDAFHVANDGTIVYIGHSVGEPSEVYRLNHQRITHLNDALANEVDIRPAEVMWVTGTEGKRVQVFIVKPHNFDPSKKYPLILNVHGGPQWQWADSFRGDWQMYPGAGYVVAFPNPHGSTGFGQEFTAEISGDWGGKPFDDLMLVTDALERLPYVDRNRMGAMGWSYGGYMMNWFEGHTTRFKAIASMMGLFDLRSFYGATEELWFPEWDLRGQPWNSDLYEKFSPSNYVKNFKTPCMVLTGEIDFRVPYTQSLQMFTALQKMNVPSRLIVFSESGHWPDWYEMALYYTAHLEWFQKYLGGGGPPWSTEAFLRNAVFDTSTGKRIEEEPKPPENPQGKGDQKPPHGQ